MEDPRLRIARGRMGAAQIIAILLAVLLNALDGFDVLSISFASPGIAAEWHIDRAALGVVLSMELIGMGVGSVLLGALADRFGRRPLALGCLVLMATGMLLAASATSVVQLSGYRLLTGFGVGGMLAATNAIVAEYSNAKRRNLWVALMAGGYPVGAVAGGAIASNLLVGGDWRLVFEFGGIVTMLFIPLVFALMPETVSFLVMRRPRNALDRVNRVLARMGHAAVPALPDTIEGLTRPSIRALFGPGLRTTTLLLTLIYFTHVVSFYFILKWAPKIVVDMGFAPSSAGFVLVWANVGGACGALLFSLLTQVVRIKPLLIVTMVLSTILVAVFGRSPADLHQLATIAGIAGFCTNAGMVGIYAMMAQAFPASARAGGTGFVIGIGRAGAAASPIIAGYLFTWGATLPMVALAMGSGSLIAAGALLALRYAAEREAA